MISENVERAVRMAWPTIPPDGEGWILYVRVAEAMCAISIAAEPYITEDDIYYLFWLGETARSLYLEEIRRD